MAQHILFADKNLVEIRPANFSPDKKYPTFNFHHGIGESGDRKTLQGMSDFHKFLDKWADGLAGEEILFILAQDMDGNVATTDHVRMAWKWADQYTDGRKGLGGLSMGGGETMIQVLSSLYYTTFADATFFMPICPPTWESEDESYVAKDNRPFWAFMGVKDAAVPIASFVNTIGDIITAGRKAGSNLYVSIYPNRDHYIWTSVLDKSIPVSPVTTATDSAGKNIYGVKSYNGISDWAIVNDPAITPMQYFLMQRKGAFKPLPRLSDQPAPAPIPEPIPEPIPQPLPAPEPVYFKNFIDTRPAFGVTWSDGTTTQWRVPTGSTVKQVYTNGDAKANKQYLKIVYSTGEKIFGPIKK